MQYAKIPGCLTVIHSRFAVCKSADCSDPEFSAKRKISHIDETTQRAQTEDSSLTDNRSCNNR